MSHKYMYIFSFILIITITFIVLYFYVFRTSDNFTISPIRGSHYDSDIELLSGGMAGSEVRDPHYRWSYSLKAPYGGNNYEINHYGGHNYRRNPYDIPYRRNPYEITYRRNHYSPYPTTITPGFYQNNPEVDRFYNCNGAYCRPIFNHIFDNPRVQNLWMSTQ